MTRGVADIVEIVVLAARTYATLRANRSRVTALLLTEEGLLELDHAGIGEQQGRIIAWHQRCRTHNGVLLLGKVV